MQPHDKIVLIGGQGQMGRFLSRLFDQAGMQSLALDRPMSSQEVQSAFADATVVLLCVPINALDEVLDRIVPFLTPPTVLSDICSVKTMPLQKMMRSYSGPVVGTHPLFGPAPEQGDPLRVAVCPGRDTVGVQTLLQLFNASGCYAFETTAEDHDKAMAYIQGLNFVTTISYLSCLPQDVDISQFLTPSFKRRLDSARKMLTQDGELFTTLFEQNPFSADCVRGFRSFLNIAAGGDLELVREKALWWWRDGTTGGEPG